eukprot:TRINITY_DN75_c0_g1_i4.p2 TRINITY_DN75_c0_g1~~TRINITY_DN75_c0_g1_i4.p2  ORF type:complete len:609 (-),score=149.00 TRINITY_DN75_c0_g1_i4:200-2026(-)
MLRNTKVWGLMEFFQVLGVPTNLRTQIVRELLGKEVMAAEEHRNASWQAGSLSDWTLTFIAVGVSQQKVYPVHRFVMGVGQRSSEMLYRIFMQSGPQVVGGNTTVELINDLKISASKDQAEEVFQRMNMVFESDVLPFMYDARVNFTFSNVFVIWRLAEHFQIHRLAEISKQFVNTNLIQKIAPKALEDSLLFGFKDIAQRCTDIIASTVDSFDASELAFLDGLVLMDIFNNMKFSGNDLSKCKIAATSLVIRERVIKPQERAALLSLFDFNPEKYGMSGSLKLLQSVSNLSESDQKDVSELEDKCLDVVSRSFPQLLEGSGSLLLTLSIPQFEKLLHREDLKVVNEDQVFRALKIFTSSKTDQLTPEQRTELWKMCRFKFLSNVCFEEAFDSNVPQELLDAAISSRDLAGEEFKHLAVAMNLGYERARGASIADKLLDTWRANTFDSARCHDQLELPSECQVAAKPFKVCAKTVLSKQGIDLGRNAVGKFCWQVVVESLTGDLNIGLASIDHKLDAFVGSTKTSWSVFSAGGTFHNGKRLKTNFPKTVSNGDRVGLVLDCRTQSLRIFHNSEDCGILFREIEGHVFPAVTLWKKGDSCRIDFTWNDE